MKSWDEVGFELMTSRFIFHFSTNWGQIAGILVQQGQIGVEEESFQIMVVIPYVLLSDHSWLQVVALFNARVCGQPIHRASATVRTPPPQCAQSIRVWVGR